MFFFRAQFRIYVVGRPQLFPKLNPLVAYKIAHPHLGEPKCWLGFVAYKREQFVSKIFQHEPFLDDVQREVYHFAFTLFSPFHHFR